MLVISNKTVAKQGTLQTSEQRNNAVYVFYGAIHYCQWDTWAYVIRETSDERLGRGVWIALIRGNVLFLRSDD